MDFRLGFDYVSRSVRERTPGKLLGIASREQEEGGPGERSMHAIILKKEVEAVVMYEHIIFCFSFVEIISTRRRVLDLYHMTPNPLPHSGVLT